MSRFIGLTAVAVLLASAGTLHAESDLAREFNQAEEQHDNAVTAATAAIDSKHELKLRSLLQRATQLGDLQTADKIQDALNRLPQIARKELAGGWHLRASTGYTADVVFHADGTGSHSGYGKFQWRIAGERVYLGTADQFRLPEKNGKLKGVNNVGNELTMTKK